MAFTKIDHFILQILLFVVNEDITFSLHDGEIWKHLLRRKYVNYAFVWTWLQHFVYFCIQNGRTLQIYTDLSSRD